MRRAYNFYLRGDEKISIVQMNAVDLVRSNAIQQDVDALMPIWQGIGQRGADDWLSVAEIAPALGIRPRLVNSSEWLACGHISRKRCSAVWPIIEGILFFDRARCEDLVDLFTDYCGRMPDCIRQQSSLGRYEYDWENEVFVETGWWKGQRESLQARNGFPSPGVGLGVASRLPRFTMFGHAGFLRGMIVMD